MNRLSSVLALNTRLIRALSLLIPAAIGVGLTGAAVRPDESGFDLLRLAGLCGVVLLFLDTRAQLAHAPERHLDEYQRKLRDRAWRTSHQITVTAMFAAFVYTLFAPGLGWWLPNVEVAGQMIFTCALMSMALPGVVLAWDDAFDPSG